MKHIAGIWMLALILMLLLAGPAAAEPVIQINGDLAPRTREEALQMVEEGLGGLFRGSGHR